MSRFTGLLAAALVLLLSGCANRVWIADWKETTPFSSPRAGTASVVVKDKLYLIGGVDGRKFVNITEYAQINKDGTLGAWQQGHPLSEERGFMEAVVHGDYVYVVGGGNGPNGHHLLRTAERAHIEADGTLGPWQTEKNEMVVTRRCSKIIATDKRIYSFGGYGGVLLDSVEYAEFMSDGSLGEWQLDPEVMTIPRYVDSVKLEGDRFFIIGGHDQSKGVGITDVEWTRYTDAGNTEKWQATTPMQQGRFGLGSSSYRDFVYAIGGLSGAEYLDSIEITRVGKDGALDPWKFTTPLDQPRANFSNIEKDGKLYVIGGTNREGYLASVIYAGRNGNGDLGYWGTAEQAEAVKAKQAERAAKKSMLPNHGKVIEFIQAEAYTYIHVQNDVNQDIWIAGQKIDDLKVGDTVGFSTGVNMSNWYSKELKRGFDAVLFVGQVRKQ
jgi:hypothetical protein